MTARDEYKASRAVFCLVPRAIPSSDNRLLLVEAIASERFGNGIRTFHKLGFTHLKGIRNMASFKNACMAFVALTIAAHSSAGGITINIWQDGSNVRAHSDGGTLNFNVFTNIQGPNEYFSSLGVHPSWRQTGRWSVAVMGLAKLTSMAVRSLGLVPLVTALWVVSSQILRAARCCRLRGDGEFTMEFPPNGHRSPGNSPSTM